MAGRRYVNKIVRNGNSLTIVIPRPLLYSLNLNRGDVVTITRVSNSILLTPISRNVDEAIASDLVEAVREEAEILR